MISALLILSVTFLVIRFAFWRRAVKVTLLVLLLGLAGELFIHSNFYQSYINPLGGAESEIEPLDYVASRQAQSPDNRQLLVNFGNIGRAEIAALIEKLSAMEPKVIGINALFNCPPGPIDSISCPFGLDTVANRMLANAIRKADNVVLVSRIRNDMSIALYDSIELSDAIFQRYARHGFDALPTTESYQNHRAVRSMFTRVNGPNGTVLAWSVAVASMYDSVKVEKFLSRGNAEELINFRGSIDLHRLRLAKNLDLDLSGFGGMFHAVDAVDVLNGIVKPEEVRGKIILMGYLGDYLGDPTAEEKFFTPLNSGAGGEGKPDSYALVINANIINMILNEDYIHEQSDWDALAMNFTFVMFHVGLLVFLRNRYPKWFDLYASILIVIQIALFSFFRIWLFREFSYRVFFDVSVITLAVAGIGINIYMELAPSLKVRWPLVGWRSKIES